MIKMVSSFSIGFNIWRDQSLFFYDRPNPLLPQIILNSNFCNTFNNNKKNLKILILWQVKIPVLGLFYRDCISIFR